MKKIILSLGLLALFANIANTQLPCATPPPTPQQYQYTKDVISQIAIQRNDGTTCIPIRSHIIRHDDGTGGVSLETINKGIATLNQYYLIAGIEFYLCGETPDYLDDDTYYEFTSTNEDAMAIAAVEVNNALNMYFVNSITVPGFGNASGYAYFPFNNIISTRVVMDNDWVANGNTMIHELGHWFNLYHTFQGTINGSGDANAENVARLPNGNANCVDHGDLICDTPADPGLSNTNFDFATCTYTGDATDVFGQLYVPDINNTMSYFPHFCQNPSFITPEQYTRIAQGLIFRQGHTWYSMDYPPTDVNDPTNLTAVYNAGIELNWIDNATNEMGFIIERSSTSDSDGFSTYENFGTGPNQLTFVDNTELLPETTYWYRVKASNDDCNNYSNVVSYTTGLIYCDASAVCDEYISMVALGNINNESTCEAGGYSDYSNLTTTVTINQSHPISITNGNPYNGDQCGLWIDWNHDGDFIDANESISISGGPNLFTGNITPPSGATIGQTKMRARIVYTGSTSPCGNLTWGETEDYSINVVGTGNSGNIQFPDSALGLGLFEYSSTYNISVSRTGGSDGIASVTVVSTGGTAIESVDYNSVNTVLTWADGEMGEKSFGITVVNDAIDEGIESFSVSLTNVVNATLGEPNVAPMEIIDMARLSAKALLQGPYDSNSQLMSDNLRVGNKIPLTEPFTGLGFTHFNSGGGETTTPEVLSITGDNAIVDWVFVEIHQDTFTPSINRTFSALIQKDGDIVSTDGVSPLVFAIYWDYFVVIKHRNHFGVRSLNSLSGIHVSSIDFTDSLTQVIGTNPMINVFGKMTMIAGDANRDGQVNSVDKNDYWRLQNGNPYNYILSTADFNMDGSINSVDKNEYWRLNNSMIEQITPPE